MVFSMLGGAAIASFDAYGKERGRQNAIDSGVIVEATMSEVRYRGRARSYSPYQVYYTYRDENGIQYEGFALGSFQTKEEASVCLGDKVCIYIDGKGNSIIVGNKAQYTWPLIASISFSTILGAGVIALIVIYHKFCKLSKLRMKRKKRNRLKQ